MSKLRVPARSLFDNSSNLRWTARSTTPWIQFEFNEGPVKAEMYTLTSGTSLVPGDPAQAILDTFRQIDATAGEAIRAAA